MLPHAAYVDGMCMFAELTGLQVVSPQVVSPDGYVCAMYPMSLLPHAAYVNGLCMFSELTGLCGVAGWLCMCHVPQVHVATCGICYGLCMFAGLTGLHGCVAPMALSFS